MEFNDTRTLLDLFIKCCGNTREGVFLSVDGRAVGGGRKESVRHHRASEVSPESLILKGEFHQTEGVAYSWSFAKAIEIGNS